MKANELKKKIDAYADNFLKHAASLGPRREVVFDDLAQENIAWVLRRDCKRHGIKFTKKMVEDKARKDERHNLLAAIRCTFYDNNPDLWQDLNKFEDLAGYIEKTCAERAEKVVKIWYAF